MTQYNSADFPIDPFTTSGQELAAILNRLADALNTSHSGAARPAYAKRGTLWLDTSGAGASPAIAKYMMFDGANDVEIAEINLTTSTVTVSNNLPLSGGTVTGPIKGVNPVDPADLTRKDYVDNLIIGKNVIINGDFQIQQRGTGITGFKSGYFLDRWRLETQGAAVSTVTAAGDRNAMSRAQQINITTVMTPGTNDYLITEQHIEGWNVAHLFDETVTLSFWVKSPKTGIHCVSIHSYQHGNSLVKEYTVNAADTWEKKEMTFLIDKAGIGGTWNVKEDAGLIVSFTLSAGTGKQTAPDTWITGDFKATANQVNVADTAGNKFLINEIQLERGVKATHFEHVPFAIAFTNCARYYQAFEKPSGSVTTQTKFDTRMNFFTNGGGKEGDDYHWKISFKTSMRVIPTFSAPPGGLFHARAGTGDSNQTVKVKNLTVNDAILSVTDTGASGETGLIKMTNDGDFIRFDAELS